MTTEFDCPLPVLEAILNEFPWMTVVRDKYGRVPLANAAGAPAGIVSNQFIHLLVLIRPETLMEKDNDKRIPLHLAIDSKKDWSSVLKVMVQSFQIVSGFKMASQNFFLSCSSLQRIGRVSTI